LLNFHPPAISIFLFDLDLPPLFKLKLKNQKRNTTGKYVSNKAFDLNKMALVLIIKIGHKYTLAENKIKVTPVQMYFHTHSLATPPQSRPIFLSTPYPVFYSMAGYS
jgi:hypothetical protein